MPAMERARGGPTRDLRGAWVVGTAMLLQVVLMAWLFPAEGGVVAGLVAAGVGFVLAWGWSRERLHAVARVAVVTAALGGLGMLAGTWLDMAQSAGAEGGLAVPACHVHRASAGDSGRGEGAASHDLGELATSWMFALMVLACVGGCTWLCGECERGRRRWIDPLVCAPGMILGMMLGGNLAGALAEWSGLGAGVAMHVTMVLGMAAGSAASCALLRALAQTRAADLSLHAP